MYVTNKSALTSISTIPFNEEIIVGGYYNVGDNGGGTFLWKTGASLPQEDGGIIIYHDTDSSGWFERNINEPYLSVRWFGAKGDGTNDDTTFIQKTLNAVADGYLNGFINLNLKTVSFTSGIYAITAPLVISNTINITCENATIKTKDIVLLEQSGLISIDKSIDGPDEITVTIENLTIDGKGYFSASTFANPYGSGTRIGFTNNNCGIIIEANITASVCIKNNTITGCNHGIYIKKSASEKQGNALVHDNIIYKVGGSGIYLDTARNCNISSNKISAVQGNFAESLSLDDSKFADGVYMSAAKDVSICNNTIFDTIRMGISVESQITGAVCKNIIISNNNIQNIHSSRGTEFNSAIWFESGKSDETCIANGNFVSNEGAEAGANSSWGIAANNGVSVSDNIIKYWDSGINGDAFSGRGNTISYCGNGISTSLQEGQVVSILNNIIQYNLEAGIAAEKPDGTLIIQQNIIEDNGQGASQNAVDFNKKTGLYIKGTTSEHLVLTVDNNTFISSYLSTYNDDGEPIGNGQQVAIYLSAFVGTYTTDFIRSNKFIFDNAYTYPDANAVPPCSLAYHSSGPVNYKEILCTLGNVNTKLLNAWPIAYYTEDWQNGFQRFLGQDSVPPASGTYQKGDYILNSNIPAGGNIGWICVAYGSPGTWVPYGIIGGVTAGTVPDSAGMAGPSYNQSEVNAILSELRALKTSLTAANLLA